MKDNAGHHGNFAKVHMDKLTVCQIIITIRRASFNVT